jgi:molecular chaperone GrpE (heat shock protein)
VSDHESLVAEIASLKAMLEDERARSERVREKAFDTLYEELKQYKEDALFQAEKPLLLDLLLFYDSMLWFHKSLAESGGDAEAQVDGFQYLLDELIEVLYRRDVHPTESADFFDKSKHKAVKVVDVEDRDGDQRIAQVLKRGFQRSGKVLRPEEVVIQRWKGGKN